MKIRDYLNEATITHGYPDTGGIAGDDDAPTGNILMGRKYKKVTVKTPGGSYQMSVPDDKWTWDEFENAKGMDDKDNYSSTLDDDPYLSQYFGGRVWAHTKTGDPDTRRREMQDIANKEESAPEYVKRVTKFAHTRDDMKKNLSPAVFKIDRVLSQFETEGAGEESEKK